MSLPQTQTCDVALEKGRKSPASSATTIAEKDMPPIENAAQQGFPNMEQPSGNLNSEKVPVVYAICVRCFRKWCIVTFILGVLTGVLIGVLIAERKVHGTWW